MRCLVPGALAVVVLVGALSPSPAVARKPKPTTCPGGRFPVSAALVPGGAAADAIVIDGTQVSVESGCPVASAERRVRRRFTILIVRWNGCGSLQGAVRLRAKLDAATCRTLTGRFRNRKARINQALSASVEVPADAFGNAGDPLPEGATLLSPAEWDQMKQRPDFHSLGPDQQKQNDAAEAASAAGDEQAVMDFLGTNPGFRAQYLGGVAPGDPSVVPTDNGNYDVTFTDASGSARTVRTHGRRFFLGNVASALRTFPSSANQQGVYDDYYAGLAGIDPALVGNLPTPAQARAMALADLLALNDGLASQSGTYLPLVQPPGGLPPPGYPATCAAEEGSGDGSDRSGGTTCGTHKALGVYANTAWPLKFFATCVKDQAARGTCWSFGSTCAIELTIAKKHSRWVNLAEQDLIWSVHGSWALRYYGDGFWPGEAFRLMTTNGYTYPFESQWDYNPSRSRRENDMTRMYTNSCVGYTSAENDFCSNTTGQGKVWCVNLLLFFFCGTAGPSHASTSAIRPLAYSEIWSSGNPTLSLGRIFWAVGIFQKPVVYSFAVAPSFYPDANGYVTYHGLHCPITTDSHGDSVCTPAPGCECDIGGHAVLITGLIDNSQLPPGAPPGSGGGYLIIKNSWGNCYGDSGYAYLPYDWVKAYGMSAVVVGDAD